MKIVMQARPVEKPPRRSQPKILGRQGRKGLLSKRRRKKERKVQVRDVSLLQFLIEVCDASRFPFLVKKINVCDQPVRPILISTNVHVSTEDF